MRKFRGKHEAPGRLDARSPRRRSRWVLTGSLLAGSVVAGAAALTGFGPAPDSGDLASFDMGRLASIVASPGHDKDAKSPRGAPEKSAPKGEGSTGKGPHEKDPAGKGPHPKGSGDSGGKHGPSGCDWDDAKGGKDAKGAPVEPAPEVKHPGKDAKDAHGSAKDAKGAPVEPAPEVKHPGKDAKDAHEPAKDAKGAPVEPAPEAKHPAKDAKAPAKDAKGMPIEEGTEGGKHGWDPRCKPEQEKVISVPCDPDELIAAVVRANAVGGATLRLKRGCTYTLTASDEQKGTVPHHALAAATLSALKSHTAGGKAKEQSGLPVIAQPIRIKGDGATIARPVGAEEFRFFTVADGGELELSDVTLKNGRAASGGSIKVESGGTAVIESTKITQSVASATQGGGGAIFSAGNLKLVKSELTANSAAGAASRGGGILNHGGVLTVEKSDFIDNSANGHGGGLANVSATADVSKSTFERNTATEGGAIASNASRTKVSNAKVADNTAQLGGGISTRAGMLSLQDVEILDNSGLGDGGGIAAAGGLVVVDDSKVKAGTTFGDGGGIFAKKAKVIVRGTKIVDNDAVGPTSVGGGLSVDDGALALSGSEVTENKSTKGPGGVFVRRAKVEVDEKTEIIKDSPTNCKGSPVKIPNCFG